MKQEYQEIFGEKFPLNIKLARRDNQYFEKLKQYKELIERTKVPNQYFDTNYFIKHNQKATVIGSNKHK